MFKNQTVRQNTAKPPQLKTGVKGGAYDLKYLKKV
jgi:hypothetical protein